MGVGRQGLSGAGAKKAWDAGGDRGLGPTSTPPCPDLPRPIEGGEIQTASTEAEAQGQMETPGAS